ncbi:MAG: tyrosine-protein phosphatase [Bacilli bacterium]|nr:tyrosine-protein phosphatase [Bacilli bacterium]
MSSLFKSTWNTRWLPKSSYRYIRTDCPRNITEEEIGFLIEHNILTVVDLREEVEYTKRPCPLENDNRFKYLHMPVSGGDVYPVTYEETMKAYETMKDDNLLKIVDTIMNADTGVIYFCAAGKDRTGVVSAVILKKLGVDEKTILDDYMISKDNLMARLEKIKQEHPNQTIRAIIPRPDYIKNILKKL